MMRLIWSLWLIIVIILSYGIFYSSDDYETLFAMEINGVDELGSDLIVGLEGQIVKFENDKLSNTFNAIDTGSGTYEFCVIDGNILVYLYREDMYIFADQNGNIIEEKIENEFPDFDSLQEVGNYRIVGRRLLKNDEIIMKIKPWFLNLWLITVATLGAGFLTYKTLETRKNEKF